MTLLFGVIDDFLFFQFALGYDSVPNLLQVFAAFFPLLQQFVDTCLDGLFFLLVPFDVLFDLPGLSV